MSQLVNRQKWNDVVFNNTQLKQLRDGIVSSIQDLADNKDTVVWVRLDALHCSKLILEEISDYLDIYMSGFVIYSLDGFKGLASLNINNGSDSNLLVNKDWNLSKLKGVLSKFSFINVNKVLQPGEFSILGDVLHLWPNGMARPIRIEFFGESIESIVSIDVASRRALEPLEGFYLSSVLDSSNLNGLERISFGSDKQNKINTQVIFSDISPLEDDFNFKYRLIKSDLKSTKLDEVKLRSALLKGWDIHFVINHKLEKAEDIRKELLDIDKSESYEEKNLENLGKITIFEEDFVQGFESPSLKLVVLTDHELWGTVKLSSEKSDKYSKLFLDEITPGDFVVHEDHGIGIYTGLREIEGSTKYSQYLELKYAEKDRLLVPLNQVQKLTKYVGVGGKKPVLTRLKGGSWLRIKNNVKRSIKKLAGELLRLYALRSMTQLTKSDFDNVELKKFAKTFDFIETEDQLRAIEEVLADLEATRPMDRLLVGDVGFGKTEVAMRAAFKMVTSGKQVALLAPTTILVEQHYHVFSQRMKNFGIRVGALSRFLSQKESETLLKELAKGQIDILIGTHRLLSSAVEFKDLGLLIIDEEQKFGVAQKENLKNKRIDCHVLSMSATPIPRTLNMALSGVKDVSVITTPPLGRKPIKNSVEKFNWDTVAKAITFEVGRGGQVYFVHNRVQTLGHVKRRLEKVLPDIRVGIGHGQMPGEQISRVMRDFNNNVYDILLCTTIIENGLDLPNVNTIIIDRSEMFGLAQLYQLRGRIGRGQKQAFAYFLYHGSGGERIVKKAVDERAKEFFLGEAEKDDMLLWSDARKRLEAIRDLEDLGSGFGLAERDLEIRGAGNFLGSQQHGHASAIGFSLYCRLLTEMIDELKKQM